MLLILVCLVMLLTTELIVLTFSNTILQHKILINTSAQAQLFEVAEIGLLYGEHQLKQIVLKNETDHIALALSPIQYAGYQITLDIAQLPQPFCLTPANKKGHYYQITAKAQAQRPTTIKIVNNTVTLQKTIAIPTHKKCTHALAKRPISRQAWCQLS